jgi:hypothetical protein
MSNLAQVEFFHIGRKSNPTMDDYKEAAEEMRRTVASSLKAGTKPLSTLKTVVRFFDTKNLLTAIAKESARLRVESETRMSGYALASLPGRVIISKECQQLARTQLLIGKRCLSLVQAELRDTVKASRELAIEDLDRSFRPAQMPELHELLERTSGAYNVWLFVFKPNDLYSLTNESVATAM